MDTNTIRVLSLDGGGMKGLFSAIFLQKFIKLWGIKSNELWKYFDVICGSSVGGIQALAYAYGLSPDDIVDILINDGPYIFTSQTLAEQIAGSCDAQTPANTLSSISKALILAANDYYYQSPASTWAQTCVTNNFGSSRLKTVLTAKFGTDTLSSLKTHTLITAYNRTDTRPTFFSNFEHPAFDGQNFSITDVALSTAAAPVLYFAPYIIGDKEYIDGGTTQNNPSNIGLTLGKMTKPIANRFCVLSVGAGRGEIGFDDLSTENLKDYPFSQVVTELSEIIRLTSAGCSETIARALDLESKYSPFSNLYHYRFNAKMDPTKTGLDNATDDSLAYLKQMAEDTFNLQEEEIINFLARLTA